MKLIKEWKWDYRRLYIYNCWIDEEDDDIKDIYLDFTPIRLIMGKNTLAFVLLNFGVCYEWDK